MSTSMIWVSPSGADTGSPPAYSNGESVARMLAAVTSSEIDVGIRRIQHGVMCLMTEALALSAQQALACNKGV